MHFRDLILASSVALMANAIPYNSHGRHHFAHQRRGGGDDFNIHVLNNCPDDKSFGIFEINSDFQMAQHGNSVDIQAGQAATIKAPYSGLGMRLSATADLGCDAQWDPQALFEFGYTAFMGGEGTAYNLSLMKGTDPSIGLAVYPHESQCAVKSCADPNNCPLDQAWTDPDQTEDGSPADTTCLYGKTNFRVVWCP